MIENHFSFRNCQVRSEELPVASVLHVEGEVDLLTAPSLKEHFVELIGRGRLIIVDCSALRFLDMAGIHVLEDCHQRAEQAGQQLFLVGSTPIVHTILAATQLNQRVPLFDTVAQALEAVGHEETSAS